MSETVAAFGCVFLVMALMIILLCSAASHKESDFKGKVVYTVPKRINVDNNTSKARPSSSKKQARATTAADELKAREDRVNGWIADVEARYGAKETEVVVKTAVEIPVEVTDETVAMTVVDTSVKDAVKTAVETQVVVPAEGISLLAHLYGDHEAVEL